MKKRRARYLWKLLFMDIPDDERPTLAEIYVAHREIQRDLMRHIALRTGLAPEDFDAAYERGFLPPWPPESHLRIEAECC